MAVFNALKTLIYALNRLKHQNIHKIKYACNKTIENIISIHTYIHKTYKKKNYIGIMKNFKYFTVF